MVMSISVHASILRNSLVKLLSDTNSRSVEIGQFCPNISLTKITNTNKKTINISDFKGKLLILDFWATWCAPCVNAMPENNMLQQKLMDKVQFLLVGNQSKKIIDTYIKSIEKVKGIRFVLPSIYEDDLLSQMFPHHYIPHYVWINQNGKVIAISNADHITEENITKAFSEENISLAVKQDRKLRTNINYTKPFYNEDEGTVLFVHQGTFGVNKLKYRSVLTKYIDNISGGSFNYTGRLIINNLSLLQMYENAYSFLSGSMSPTLRNRIILEVRDSSKFKYPKTSDERSVWVKSNCFVYDLVFPDFYTGPKVTIGSDTLRWYACELQKQELDYYSGYHSSIENRLIDCLVLKCTDSTKVKSNDQYEKYEEAPGRLGVTFSNNDISKFIFMFKLWLQNMPPFVDESGYHGLVNLKINAPLYDYKAVNLELKKYGLEFDIEKRAIPMVVIKD